MTNNKVSKARIDGMIQSLRFEFARVSDTTTTACWAFLPNGFGVGHGESACVDPENYDQSLGEKYAKERCVQAAENKLWELEGYLLANGAQKAEPSDYMDRLLLERGDLSEKLFKLSDFLKSPRASVLSEAALTLMLEQGEAMASYFEILNKRIELANA